MWRREWGRKWKADIPPHLPCFLSSVTRRRGPTGLRPLRPITRWAPGGGGGVTWLTALIPHVPRRLARSHSQPLRPESPANPAVNAGASGKWGERGVARWIKDNGGNIYNPVGSSDKAEDKQ